MTLLQESHQKGEFATGLLYINVSKNYTTHGEYKLSINVTDRAGNTGWLNRTLVVQANTTAHPDLSIVAGTLRITTPRHRPQDNSCVAVVLFLGPGSASSAAPG